MAPCEITEDYYAILEISQNASQEVVTKSYRRLALALHPDRNPKKVNATVSFQTLVGAYETIKDPEQRKTYDLQWPRIKLRRSTEAQSVKRQKEAEAAEKARAAQQQAKQQKEAAAWQDQLRPLEEERRQHENELFHIKRKMTNLAGALKSLQAKDDEDMRKEQERNSWWTYITSPIYGKPAPETDEQKQGRDAQCLQRLHAKNIKEKDLLYEEARRGLLQDRLADVQKKLAAAKQKIERAKQAEAARVQEQLRQEQEAKRRAQEQEDRDRRAKFAEELMRRRKEEQASRAAQQAKEAQEARETQERAREKMAAYLREAKEEAERLNRKAETAGRPNRSTALCRHKAFWPKIQGAHACSNCYQLQRRFAFRCPGCSMVACANCRKTLRGERRNDNSNFRYAGAGVRQEDYEFNDASFADDYWD